MPGTKIPANVNHYQFFMIVLEMGTSSPIVVLESDITVNQEFFLSFLHLKVEGLTLLTNINKMNRTVGMVSSSNALNLRHTYKEIFY